MYKIIAVLFILLLGCQTKDDELPDLQNVQEVINFNKSRSNINQGVAGTVYISKGICNLTGPGSTGSGNCRLEIAQREVYLFSGATNREVVGKYPHFDSIKTELIAHKVCDEYGFFEFSLDTGIYSIFIKENKKYYVSLASIINGEVYPGGFKVIQNEPVFYEFEIDYSP